MKKKYLIIGIVLLILLGGSLLLFKSNNKVIDDIKIYSYKLEHDHNHTKYIFNIKNNGKTRNIKYIMIKIKTKDKDYVLYGNVGSIKKGEKKEIIASYDEVIDNIKNVSYTIIKN